MAGVNVALFDESGFVAEILTAANGRYTLTGVAPGDYTVRFVPAGASLRGEYYDDAVSPRDATTITVAGSEVITGIDAVLSLHTTPLFTDVPFGAPFYAEIEWLVFNGVTTGYPDGSFHPSEPVSRQAMAAFLYRFAGEPAFTPPATASFTDVPVSSPFFLEVEWLASTGIATGYSDGSFQPSAPVSRQAMAAFLYRFAGDGVVHRCADQLAVLP